jgi:Tol biopolymer transport system component
MMRLPRALMVFPLVVVLLTACSGRTGSSSTAGPSGSAGPLPSVSAAAAATSTSPSASATTISVLSGEPWILYRGVIGGGTRIRLMRPDGADDHEVAPSVPLPPDGIQFSPDWSPDGMRIAFGADDANGDGTRDLWVADVGTADAVRVFDCVRPCDQIGAPAWSPDGRSIAYTTWDVIGSNVVRQRIDSFDLATGTGKTLATAAGAMWLDEARWSVDGRSLVVELSQWTDTSVNNTRTASAIGVIDLTTAHPEARRLTDWTLWATYPDWHPTKDLIVFSTRPWTALDLGPSNLYTIRPDGSKMTALTDFTVGQSRAVQPSWTPDGKGIMFTKVDGEGFGSPTMAVIDADGTGPRSATGAVWLVGTHPRLRPQP